jgi:hypothetical protein
MRARMKAMLREILAERDARMRDLQANFAAGYAEALCDLGAISHKEHVQYGADLVEALDACDEAARVKWLH